MLRAPALEVDVRARRRLRRRRHCLVLLAFLLFRSRRICFFSSRERERVWPVGWRGEGRSGGS